MYLVQKYLSDTLQNKHFKISISLFSLQENPVLLVPWMAYTIFYLIVNTILTIVMAVEYIGSIVFSFYGVLWIVLVTAYFGK